MMWTLVRSFVPYLSRDYREALLEYDKEIQGTKTAKPRWLHCIEELNSYYHGLTFAVGYMWIKNVFDKDIIPFVSIPCRCRFESDQLPLSRWQMLIYLYMYLLN